MSLSLVANARSKNVPLTDEILKEKAKHFGDETGVTDFKYSNGWLQRFKISRFCLSSNKLRFLFKDNIFMTTIKLQFLLRIKSNH
jgi:hypothetical protein